MVGAPPIATRPAELVREAAMPYRSVFDVVWSGRRHIMMMASQIDRTGNQNISAIGPHDQPKVQLVGVRGAPGNSVNHPTSYWVPDHTVRTFVEQVDVVCGVGYARAAAAGAGRHALPRRPPRRLQPRRVRLRDARPHHAPALAPPRRHRRRHRGRHRLRAHRPRRRGRDAPAHARGARPHPRRARPGLAARPRGADLSATSRRRPGQRPCTRRSTPSCASASACATRSCRPAWAGWPAPAWSPPPPRRAGSGILASATMTLDELAGAIAEVRSRTAAPFGVNLRTDVADVDERIELMIETGARVASFAQAPNPALVTRCKEAGLFVMPTVGARRHAEKVAEWGVDAVIAQGGEGGGHTGHRPHDAPAAPGRRRRRRPGPRPRGRAASSAGAAWWPPWPTAPPAWPWAPASCSRPRAGCPTPSRRSTWARP